MKHTGLFGGTFNPIHLAHLRAAQEVKEKFALDVIFLIPSALPPHKTPIDIADAKDRLEMTGLALSNYPDFAVSDVELKRSGPSYTIDTINHFQQIIPENSRLHLVLGFDAFLEIDTWKSYRDLFQLIPFIVMARPGSGCDTYNENRKIIEIFLKEKISDGYKYLSSESCCVHDEKQRVHFFKVTPMDISSTQIRNYIREGKSIQFLVTENVKNYIQKKGLYR